MGQSWLASSSAPISDRAQARSEVFRSLTSAYLFGSVVVGKAGVGKSNFLHQVLSDVGEGTHIVLVRGTALAAGKQYSALAYLLKDLALNEYDGCETVTNALTGYLQAKAGADQIIMLIENADALDVESADVLAQLALNRSVKLLVACRDLAQCPPSLMTLWLEGALLRIDLNRMSLAEGKALLSQELQGRISRAAAHALWDCGAGNARLMQLLVHDFVHSGKLVLQGETWVLCRGPIKVAQSTADATIARLGPLSDQQTLLLEMLALSGQMPIALAMALGTVEDLDHLHTVGAIELLPGPQQMVRTEWLVAQVVRERVGPFRRINYLEAVRSAHPGEDLPIHPVRLAEWTLECGLSLTPKQGFEAMRLANDHEDPDTALRVAAALGGEDSADLPLMLETARAHLQEEDEASALRVLDKARIAARNSFPDGELGCLDSSERGGAGLQIELIRASLVRLERPKCSQPGESVGVPQGDNEVLLAQLEQLASEGRYEAIRPAVESIEGGRRRAEPETEIQLLGLIGLAHAVTDRQREALGIVEEVRASLHSVRLSIPARARLTVRVNLILQLTGQLVGDGNGASHYLESGTEDGTAGELLDGIYAAQQGRAPEALQYLIPALAQLQVYDRMGLKNVASAAAAYSYALQGDLVRMRPLLVPFDDRQDATPTGIPLYSLRYFIALTLAVIGSGSEAVARLEELAREESEAGRFALELPVRAAILRLGGHGAAEPLLAVATRIQGPFAEMCTRFAEGILHKKPDLLLEAVRDADSMHNDLFSTAIKNAARAIAVATGDRTLARQVRRVMVTTPDQTEEVDADKQLNLLTPREEEVARLARVGMGNKEMASRMHVSVRTVEGHLYQIYVKLGVSSKADLIAALRDGKSE